MFQKSDELALKMAWDSYLDANDRWKNIEAQKQAKMEIKVAFQKYLLHKNLKAQGVWF